MPLGVGIIGGRSYPPCELRRRHPPPGRLDRRVVHNPEHVSDWFLATASAASALAASTDVFLFGVPRLRPLFFLLPPASLRKSENPF
jgi:hypothetical protein